MSRPPDEPGLLADLYAFTMLEAYLREGLTGPAAFSLFCRRLPPGRGYLLAAGLEPVLEALEGLRFGPAALDYLAGLGLSRAALDYLAAFRFQGDVDAVAEGTPVFAAEPLLELEAPLPMAQLVEGWVLNQLHLPTLVASKAARLVGAARGRAVVEFGLRRAQGADAALLGARAAYLAGLDATSDLLAGQRFGIPVAGTMAHSYVQAHASQLQAFRAFAQTWPRTVLLVDTYDTLEGVRDVIRLARELGPAFQVSAIRLDSGDLLALSRQARALLDEAGLERVGIFASGGLDEREVERLVLAGAPITGFGVGTALAVSDDAPSLDLVYKLVAYQGLDRTKLSPGKALLPGRKQVFRVEVAGEAAYDVLAGAGERLPGEPLLQPVMRGGLRVRPGPGLAGLREAARARLARLPEPLRGLEAAEPYPVLVSPALKARQARLVERLAAAPGEALSP